MPFWQEFLLARAILWNLTKSMARVGAILWCMILSMREWQFLKPKYAKTKDALAAECEAALEQIDDRQYAKDFADDYDEVLCYGIAFFKKRCLVKKK